MLDKGFFRLARNVSRKSPLRIKVGAVLVCHGKPVSVGFNYEKSHPLHTRGFRNTIHAEISALLSCDADLTGGVCYIYREKADGSLGLSRPCNYCYKQLVQAGIKKIYYSTNSGYAIERI